MIVTDCSNGRHGSLTDGLVYCELNADQNDQCAAAGEAPSQSWCYNRCEKSSWRGSGSSSKWTSN